MLTLFLKMKYKNDHKNNNKITPTGPRQFDKSSAVYEGNNNEVSFIMSLLYKY